MPSLFCTQGHENAPDSRFCRLCGEKLVTHPAANGSPGNDLPASHPSEINPHARVGVGAATVVGLRYRILNQLSSGGFGRTYLGEDLHRFNESCVLKEFAPQVEGAEALRKAESLFQREAGVLYRLQHPQIPKFRELLRAEFEGRERLFLVQDYIKGQTYQDLIEDRCRRGNPFTEADVVTFLTQLLPVLQYIHSAGVIHRDIAPDNLILRESDQIPILIDFGGVKQAAFAAASELTPGSQSPPDAAVLTLLGKPGYAPEEQLHSGQAYPHSDLYSLAVTVVVMLTGRSPQMLVGDANPMAWQSQVRVSPWLQAILAKMLARSSGDRYPSAREVLQALNARRQDPRAFSPPSQSDVPSAKTVRAVPYPSSSSASSSSYPPSSSPPTYAPMHAIRPPTPTQSVTIAAGPNSPRIHRSTQSSIGLRQVIGAIALVGGVAIVGWFVGFHWLSTLLNPSPRPPSSEETISESSGFSAPEQDRKDSIQTQRQQLGIDESFLVRLTDASFYRQYPDQAGRSLTDAPGDAEWRSRWDAIALEWLDELENILSAEARRNLGSYDDVELDIWRQSVSQLYVSSRALYNLADAKFLHLFPDQRDTDFMNQPIGQIWYGLADDELNRLQSGQTLTRLRFDDGEFGDQVSGSLRPGEGHVYIMGLSEGQMMRLNLQAPPESTQLSLYVPTPDADLPYLLDNSADPVWAGQLPQSGFYEVVIIATTPDSVGYQLRVAVENVTNQGQAGSRSIF